jgi:hypothetical protein
MSNRELSRAEQLNALSPAERAEILAPRRRAGRIGGLPSG